MRTILAVIGLAAFAANADDFRARAPITLQGTDPFQRIQLPFEAYREARRDLGDIRVMNARGESVPFAFAGEAEPEKAPTVTAVLPQFPIISRPTLATTAAGRLDVRVRARGDGTIISVEERPPGKAVPPAIRPIAYLLDASQLKFPIGQLRFDWDAGPGAEVVKVSVEGSDDLRAWSSLASRAALVRVEQGGQVLAQTQVALHGARPKYLRVTWDGGAFALRSVTAESAPEVIPPERKSMRVASAQRGKDGELVFDLGARLPVEAIRVEFPETNSLALFEVSVRDGNKDATSRDGNKDAPWRVVAAATFYRITRDNVELLSPPLEVGRVTAREWRLRPQVKSTGAEGAMPSIEVLWRPAEVVFVAKGEPPFTLAFGDAEMKPAAIPISSLMPNYERRAERKLPVAPVGAVQVTRDDSPWRGYLGDISPKRTALWAVLVIAVLVLGFMAWRLQGQMKAR